MIAETPPLSRARTLARDGLPRISDVSDPTLRALLIEKRRRQAAAATADLERRARVPKKDRPTCGARTRKGTPCQVRKLHRGGKCRRHGGLSTGARTEEGKARVLAALAAGRATQAARRKLAASQACAGA